MRNAVSFRRLDIQGLRAIAILMVVAFHAGLPIPGGFVGVDVFFVISGYVITGMLQREQASGSRIRLRRFFARRYKRLTPALALVVSVTMLLAIALLSPLGAQQVAAKTGIGAMLLAANVVIARTTGGYFDAPADLNPLLNTWSLSVEEQFDLVFPLILAVAWWASRRRYLAASPVIVVSTIAVISFVVTLATSGGGSMNSLPITFDWLPSEAVGFYGPVSRAWEFAVGAILVLLRTRDPRQSTATFSAVLGLAMIIGSMWLISELTPGPGARNLLPVFGTALLLYAGATTNPVSKALACRPLTSLGNVSYSWYLWHWPLIVFALLLFPSYPWAAPIAAMISIAPAVLSFRFLEEPIRTAVLVGKKRWILLITLTSGVSITFAALVLVLCSVGYGTATENAQRSMRLHAVDVAGCAPAEPYIDIPWSSCRWNESARGERIYLLGDSNAGHFSEAVISAGDRLGRPVTILAAPTCPFMDLRSYGPVEPDTCSGYVARAVDYLRTQPPSTIIIGSSSLPSMPLEIAGDDSGTEAWARASAQYISAVLQDTVEVLQSAGHTVVLTQVAIQFANDPHVFDVYKCTVWTLNMDQCDQTMSRKFADQRQKLMIDAYSQAAQSTSAKLIDVRDELCPLEACTTSLDGVFRYRDSTHISVDQSSWLAPLFENALKPETS